MTELMETKIAGVWIKPLRKIPDERGMIMHMLRADEPAFEKRGKPAKDVRYALIKPVEIGIASDTHYEVLSGLEADEEIIIGSYRAISRDLKHNSEVKAGGGGKNNRRR